MRMLKRFLKRLGSWATARQSDDRLQEEIEDHLAHQAADNVRAGLSPAEARRHAALKFGAVEALKETCREQRGFPLLEQLFHDSRHALRRCAWPRHSPSRPR